MVFVYLWFSKYGWVVVDVDACLFVFVLLGCCLVWFADCLGYLLDAYAVVLPGFRLFPAGLLGCCCLLFKDCVFILGWLLVWFVFAG